MRCQNIRFQAIFLEQHLGEVYHQRGACFIFFTILLYKENHHPISMVYYHASVRFGWIAKSIMQRVHVCFPILFLYISPCHKFIGFDSSSFQLCYFFNYFSFCFPFSWHVFIVTLSMCSVIFFYFFFPIFFLIHWH